MSDEAADFGHTEQAEARRAEKVRALAAYCWDRALSSVDLRSMPDAKRRRLARAAEVHPPSSWETWGQVCEALDAKDAWAARNPRHPRAVRPLPLSRAQWVESPPPRPPDRTNPVQGDDVPLFGENDS